MSVEDKDKVLVLVVRGKVKPGRVEEFKAIWKPLAEYVAANEPGCLSYQFSQLEGDPDSFLIFERFITKEYLETVHWTSEEFKTFGQKMREADLWVEKSSQKFLEEPGRGFMAR